MSTVNKLNSHANQKEKTLGDIPFNPKIASTDRYEADSADGQTVINLNFSVDMANKTGFKLHINGVGPLREGGVNDYIFTSIQADNTSSQIMLTQAIVGIVNIVAINDKVVKEANPNIANIKSELNRRKVNANYILNGTFEYEEVAGWYLYNDGAAAFPVDGIGGSVNPNVTFATTTIAALRGAKSAVLSKDAANRQGHGVSYDFQIDLADTNKSLTLKMDVASSSNYQAGFVTAYIYDKTANNLVSAIPAAVSSQGLFLASFAATNSTQYRLILHIASADTTAWTLKIDSVEAGQPDFITGYAGSDWVDFPMILNTHLNSPPTKGGVVFDQAQWRRDGQDMLIRWDYCQNSAGTSGSGSYQWLLPAGYKIDLTKVTVYGDGDGFVGESDKYLDSIVGWGLFNNSNIREFQTAMFPVADDRLGGFWESGGQYVNDLNHGVGLGVSANWRMTFEVRVPIANWDSNTQLTGSRVEYAFNSNTSDSDDLTSFNYGPVGQLIGSYTTAERTKRVRFPNPVSQTDHVFAEVEENGKWIRLADHSLNPSQQGSLSYGIRIVPVSGSTTDYDVKFGSGGGTSSNATYATAGSAWSGYTGLSWRLVKSANALGVESSPSSLDSYAILGNGPIAVATDSGNFSSRFVSALSFGPDITTTQSVGQGDYFTILNTGLYEVYFSVRPTAFSDWYVKRNEFGVSNLNPITDKDTLIIYAENPGATRPVNVSKIFKGNPGDKVALINADSDPGNGHATFELRRIR